MRVLIWVLPLMILVMSVGATSAQAPTVEAAGGSPMVHTASAAAAPITPAVMAKIAQARVATAKYATNLERAKADGYMIITPMIPNMGYHFLNPKIQGFDVTNPPILVYVRDGDGWQLVAIEWV